MLKFRTDLAVENREMFEGDGVEISGVEVKEEYSAGIKVLSIKVTDEHGSEVMGKPIGNYITIECEKISDADDREKRQCARVITEEIKKMLPDKKPLNALVVGLGNEKVTPDALGPITIDKITATRHYFLTYKDQIEKGVGCISAITPGVMGDTGIESADIVMGTVEVVKPDVIIAIDSLAARNTDRMSTTIQISDTGISPGAGMGNRRKGLNEESTGTKVIAIGVPTVIDAATLVFDTLMNYGIKDIGHELGDKIASLAVIMENDEEMTSRFMADISGKMIVTSSEIDTVIHEFSNVLANGINAALHSGISMSEIHNSFG